MNMEGTQADELKKAVITITEGKDENITVSVEFFPDGVRNINADCHCLAIIGFQAIRHALKFCGGFDEAGEEK